MQKQIQIKVSGQNISLSINISIVKLNFCIEAIIINSKIASEMNQHIKKKREVFRKEIKNQAIQKKKNQIRKTLPYYDQHFKDFDSQSSCSNSRSSRFPIRNCSNNQNSMNSQQSFSLSSNSLSHSTQASLSEQQAYIKYLQNLSQINLPGQIEQFIKIQCENVFGRSCFHDLQELKYRVQARVIQYEYSFELTSAHNFQSKYSSLSTSDWNFLIASYYFSRKMKFQELSASCFYMIAKNFNNWQEVIFNSQIKSNIKIQDLKIQCKQLESIEIKIQDIIISKLTDLSQSNYVESQNNFQQNSYDEIILLTVSYFREKYERFRREQRLISQNYLNFECLNFTEIMYNFQSEYTIFTLNKLTAQKDISIYTQQSIIQFGCRYFQMYPPITNAEQNLKNQSLAHDQINLLQNINIFLNKRRHSQKIHEIKPNQFKFFGSVLTFLIEILQRKNENYHHLKVISIFGEIIQSLMITNLEKSFNDEVSFHIKILDLSIMIFGRVEASDNFYKKMPYFEYLYCIFGYFVKIKANNRSLIKRITNIQNQGLINRKINQFFSFEYYFLYNLYILLILPNSKKDISQISKLLQFSQEFYQKQSETIKTLENYHIQFSKILIFSQNINIFYQIISHKEIMKLAQESNPEETQSSYQSQDIQI